MVNIPTAAEAIPVQARDQPAPHPTHPLPTAPSLQDIIAAEASRLLDSAIRKPAAPENPDAAPATSPATEGHNFLLFWIAILGCIAGLLLFYRLRQSVAGAKAIRPRKDRADAHRRMGSESAWLAEEKTGLRDRAAQNPR